MYELLIKQIDAMLINETNTIGNLANASALLFQTLPDINWAGFYLYSKKNNELVLGPFQGSVACMHIPMNKGVCGSAAYQKQTLMVEDVHAFPGHIACDRASNSEIVIPLIIDNHLFGVLDIDSPTLARFNFDDQKYLELFVEAMIKHLSQPVINKREVLRIVL